MNIQGNVRSRATKEKIYKALMYLLKHKTFSEIYVKDICTIACINRSSFYEHYQDINDLMIQTETTLSNKMNDLFGSTPYSNLESYVKMFAFIKENKEFYYAYLNNSDGSFMGQTDFHNHAERLNKTAIKYDYDNGKLIYHMAFFSAGLKAICKVWLSTGMNETPEEMANIIFKEYSEKIKFFR